MLQYISKDFFGQLPNQVEDTLIRISGNYQVYISDPGNINQQFTIGIILDLLNRHINPDYHVTQFTFKNNIWKLDAPAYSTEDTELVVALWKALVYCYNEEKREKEREERERIWKESNEEMVTVRRSR